MLYEKLRAIEQAAQGLPEELWMVGRVRQLADKTEGERACIDYIDALRAHAAGLQADARRLDWAESNPVAAMHEIQTRISICGRGGWEIKFNFRGAIDAAIDQAEGGE